MAKMDLAAMALGGSKDSPKPKKEISEMHIRRTKNGKHIIKHKHTMPENHPDEEYGMDNDEQMMNHVQENMGTPSPDDMGDGGTPQPQNPQQGM